MFKAIRDLFIPNNMLLLEAARNEDWESVKSLIKKGVDVNARYESKDKDGLTALSFAVTFKKFTVAKWLIEAGANVKTKYAGGLTVLHDAVKGGELCVIRLLIEAGADVNAVDDWGDTVLRYAVISGQLDAIELLVDKRCDVNAKTRNDVTIRNWMVDSTSYYGTALHVAAWTGKLDVVELLVKEGCDVNAKTGEGKTVLSMAVKSKNVNVVKWLIDNGANINSTSYYGMTVLHQAVKSGCVDIAELLVKKGCDANAKGHLGKTVLQEAVQSKDVAMVQYLLTVGANAESRSEYDDSPLIEACNQKHENMVKILLPHIFSNSTFRKALNSSYGKIKSLIQERQDLIERVNEQLVNAAINKDYRAIQEVSTLWDSMNTHRGEGSYPSFLHYAASRHDIEVVEFLLKTNIVNIAAQDHYGRTPLHTAALRGREAIVKCLIAAGADKEAQDMDGHTPGEVAKESKIIRILTQDKQIFEAAKKGDYKKVAELLLTGANIDTQDKHGEALLHHVAKSGNLDVVRLLVENGANINVLDKTDLTPLYIAASSGHFDIVKYLVETGKCSKESETKFIKDYTCKFKSLEQVEIYFSMAVGRLKQRLIKESEEFLAVVLSFSELTAEQKHDYQKLYSKTKLEHLSKDNTAGNNGMDQHKITAVAAKEAKAEPTSTILHQNKKPETTMVNESLGTTKVVIENEIASNDVKIVSTVTSASSTESAMKNDGQDIYLVSFDPAEETAAQMQEINKDMRSVNYYDGFKAALSKAYITARKIVNKEFITDADKAHKTIKAKALSLIPFCGNMPGNKIEDIVDFIQSARCQKDVQKFMNLLPDENIFPTTIDKMAREIVLHDRTKNIFAQNKAAAETSGWFKIIRTKCRTLGVELTNELFEEHYESAEAKLGYKDSTMIIDMWISGKITRSEDKTIERSLIDAIVAPQPVAQTECTVMMVREVKYDNPLLNYWLTSSPNSLKDLEKVCGHEMVMWLIDCTASKTALSGKSAMDENMVTIAHEAVNMGEIVYHE